MDVQVFPTRGAGRGRRRSPTIPPTASTSRSTSTSTPSATGCAASSATHPESAELRLTVDTPEDYELVKSVFEGLYPPARRSASTRSSTLFAAHAGAGRAQPAHRAEAGAMRAAVLGCGTIGAGTGEPHPDVGVMTHAGAYAACPGHRAGRRLPTPSARTRPAARWGARAYTDPHALLAREQRRRSSASPRPTPRTPSCVAACLRSAGVRARAGREAARADAGRGARRWWRWRASAASCSPSTTRRRFAPAFQRPRRVDARGAPARQRRLREGPQAQRHALARPAAAAGGRADRRCAAGTGCGEGGEDPTLDAELALAGGAGARLAALDTTAFTAFEMDLVGHRRPRAHRRGRSRARALRAVGDDPRNPGYRVLVERRASTGALRDGTLHAVARRRALRPHGRRARLQRSGRGRGARAG